MTDVFVYDKNGIHINTVVIPDTITYVNGRVSKGDKYYYKGAGITYTHHYSIRQDLEDQYNILGKSDIFYLGNVVEKKSFKNKSGIFQEQYQPHFTDHIGACGVKELSMIENSIDFELSSADVIKVVEIDKINKQYYLILNYKCGRNKFTKDSDLTRVRTLLDYMIQTDWNFPWDKDSITDITDIGLICDTADIYKSSLLNHKLGTVYSLLYSMFHFDKTVYNKFIYQYQLVHTSPSSFVFNSIEILKQNNIDVSSLFVSNSLKDNYIHIVLNYLVSGKNCADCNLVDFGEKVRKQYMENTIRQLSR